MTQFAERLRVARQAMGLSQAQLADILDVKPSAVSRWEKGGGIEAFRLPIIAEKLGRPVEWFQGQTEPELSDELSALKARLNRLEAAQSQNEIDPRPAAASLIDVIPRLRDDQLKKVLDIAMGLSNMNNPKPLAKPKRS